MSLWDAGGGLRGSFVEKLDVAQDQSELERQRISRSALGSRDERRLLGLEGLEDRWDVLNVHTVDDQILGGSRRRKEDLHLTFLPVFRMTDRLREKAGHERPEKQVGTGLGFSHGLPLECS